MEKRSEMRRRPPSGNPWKVVKLTSFVGKSFILFGEFEANCCSEDLLMKLAMKIVALLFAVFGPLNAQAATATFTQPVANPGASAGAADGAGVLAPAGGVGLVIDTPFGANLTDTVTVFPVNGPGFAFTRISYGVWNNGAPTLFQSVFGTELAPTTLTNLAGNGCQAAGGCDFLQLETGGAFFGSPGAVFDAVEINGAPLTAALNPVTSAPEPSVWMLMILSFAGLGARMKSVKRRSVTGGAVGRRTGAGSDDFRACDRFAMKDSPAGLPVLSSPLFAKRRVEIT